MLAASAMGARARTTKIYGDKTYGDRRQSDPRLDAAVDHFVQRHLDRLLQFQR